MKELIDKIKVIVSGGHCKCNHDPKSPDNTLRMITRRMMVVPNTCMAVCTECNKTFKFTKDIHGYHKVN